MSREDFSETIETMKPGTTVAVSQGDNGHCLLQLGPNASGLYDIAYLKDEQVGRLANILRAYLSGGAGLMPRLEDIVLIPDAAAFTLTLESLSTLKFEHIQTYEDYRDYDAYLADDETPPIRFTFNVKTRRAYAIHQEQQINGLTEEYARQLLAACGCAWID